MAFERLQQVWSNDRTLQRAGRYLLVDKPAGVPCGKPGERDLAALDLRERVRQHGLGEFELCQELPERASGVTSLALADAASLRAAASDPIEWREYVLGLEDVRLPVEGQLRAAGGDGPTPLEYRVARRQGSRALVTVRARSGPEQVLRAFAAAGQPVVGAETSPAAATRLLLHVERAHGHGLSAEAVLPSEFESWLGGAPVRPPSQFAQALAEGALVRASLCPQHEAYRLLGEGAGEIAGVTADRYAEHAVLDLSTEEAWEARAQLAECLMDHGARGVYVKRRLRADLRKRDPLELAPPLPVCGAPAPEELSVRQGELRFWVRLADGLATGLFLDQRENWQRVRLCVRGTRLLNLFSYTGAFSVAAASGSASGSVSVDLSKRALSRLGLNLELNGLSGPQHRLLASDVLVWLARAGRTQQRFGWIVLDPPSFGTRRGGVLRAERDYAGLVRQALGLLERGGRLLCVSHQLGFSQRDLNELVRQALADSGRAGAVENWVGGWDAPTLPGVSGTKSVLAQVE
jgi:23S rRNA (cytosine1962-C5)-methyltransferase